MNKQPPIAESTSLPLVPELAPCAAPCYSRALRMRLTPTARRRVRNGQKTPFPRTGGGGWFFLGGVSSEGRTVTFSHCMIAWLLPWSTRTP